MIEKQAEQISRLNNDLRRANDAYNTLAAQIEAVKENIRVNQRAGGFYRQLVRAIQDNPILQSEWRRFCSFLKLAEFDQYRAEVGPAEAADEFPFLDLSDEYVSYDRLRRKY